MKLNDSQDGSAASVTETPKASKEASLGLCQCGCGGKTSLAPFNDRSAGWVKGQPLRFIRWHIGRLQKPQDVGARLMQRILKDTSGCWLWTGPLSKWGYGEFTPHYSGGYAHRIAYETFVGSIPPGLNVLHKCDVRRCINPDHLYLGDHHDNMRDMTTRGRQYAKLTASLVRELRTLSATGVPFTEMAAKYGVQPSTIQNAVTGKTWRHVQ